MAAPERPGDRLGYQLVWSADVVSARELFHEVRSAVEGRNDALAEGAALWFLSHLEWRAGNWEVADRYAADSMDLMIQLGRLMPPDEFPASFIAAHRGRTR